jgi:hypothetical protein
MSDAYPFKTNREQLKKASYGYDVQGTKEEIKKDLREHDVSLKAKTMIREALQFLIGDFDPMFMDYILFEGNDGWTTYIQGDTGLVNVEWCGYPKYSPYSNIAKKRHKYDSRVEWRVKVHKKFSERTNNPIPLIEEAARTLSPLLGKHEYLDRDTRKRWFLLREEDHWLNSTSYRE